MTAIAGFVNGKSCAIAGDSGLFESNIDGTSFTDIWWPSPTPKVWRAGDFLLGSSGSHGPTKMAEESKIGDPQKLADFMKERKESIGTDQDWEIMVVSRRGIWMVWQDFSIERMKRTYHATGGASAPALGALALAKHEKLSPLFAVRFAIQVAIDHHVHARPPVVTKEIK